MSSTVKTLKLWGNSATNPPKVAFILEELGLPYEAINISLNDVKTTAILAINPNGRIPILHDPNTDLTIWESGAIIQYLVSTYDKSHKLSFPANTAEYWAATQYLFFQVSGQGPYYGNAFYFKRIADPPSPAATERFINETKRVSGVIEGLLSKAEPDRDGHKWLVSGKLSYVDFAFLTYQLTALRFFNEDGFDEAAEFPNIKKWREALMKRDSVKTVLQRGEPWKNLGLYD